MRQLSPISLGDFVGVFKKDRRLVEYTNTFLQWAEIAEKFNKLFIIQGGFAVELSAGKISRIHDDLDILVLASEASWFKEKFPVNGYKLKYTEGKNLEQHFCAYKYNFMIEDCLYIDVGSLHLDETKVWDDEDGEKYIWPVKTEELFWARSVNDQRVKFLNPSLVYEFKKKQSEKDVRRDKEDHDFGILKGFTE